MVKQSGRRYLVLQKIGLLFVLCALVSGCAFFQEKVLLDLGAAKAIAQKYKDPVGERCWTYIESEINTAGILDEKTKGVASIVEVARIIRLYGPERRKQITAACGEVILDVMIELGKRARR